MSSSIAYPIAEGVIVILATALMLAAEHWRWKPNLAIALLVAFALRGGLFMLAIHRSWQPIDFFRDFQIAGDRVLHGIDPLTSTRTQGWNYLPLMAYVFAGQLKLGALLGLSWPTIGRVVPILADIGLMAVVGRLATEERALRCFQYACCPIALEVSAVHGQMEPLTMLFAVAGILVATRGSPGGGGALVAMAIAAKSFPVLFVPALLRSLRSVRDWVAAALGGALVLLLFFGSLVAFLGESGMHGLIDATRVILRYRSITGTWGWTGVGRIIVGPGRAHQLAGTWGRAGTILTIAAVVAVIILWRRAHPVDLASALVLAFLVVTSGFGAQYLFWPVAFLLARPTRFSMAAITAGGLWAGYGYIGGSTIRGHALAVGYSWWVGLSAVVIVLFVAAMPWERRRVRETVADVAAEGHGRRHRAAVSP